MTIPKVIILDRDGTIIKHIHYLGNPSLLELNKDFKNFIKWTENKGINLYLHSNQSALEKGLFSFNSLMRVHIEMLHLIGAEKIKRSYYSKGMRSKYRKPKKSIVKTIIRTQNVSLDKIIMIGDSDVDFETAQNAGIQSFIINTGLNKPTRTKKLYNNFKEIINEIEKTSLEELTL